jgi:hypothetical protein
MSELWKVVEEFPNYEVSNLGGVRNAKHDRPNKTSINNRGILITAFYKHGKLYRRALSNVVARLFLPPPEREDFNSVINLNGDRFNCRSDNLAWRPYHFAVKYFRERALEPFPRWNKPFVMVETGEVFQSPNECATRYGLLETGIYLSLVKGNTVFPGDYTFTFKT